MADERRRRLEELRKRKRLAELRAREARAALREADRMTLPEKLSQLASMGRQRIEREGSLIGPMSGNTAAAVTGLGQGIASTLDTLAFPLIRGAQALGADISNTPITNLVSRPTLSEFRPETEFQESVRAGAQTAGAGLPFMAVPGMAALRAPMSATGGSLLARIQAAPGRTAIAETAAAAGAGTGEQIARAQFPDQPLAPIAGALVGGITPNMLAATGGAAARGLIRGRQGLAPGAQTLLKEGDPVTVAQAFPARRLSMLEATAEKPAGGFGVFRDALENQTNRFRDRVIRLADDLDDDIAKDPARLGKRIERDVDAFFDTGRPRNRMNELWGRVDAAFPEGTRVSTENARRALQTLSPEAKEATDFIQTLQGSRLGKLREQLADDLPYEDLREIRSIIGEKLSGSAGIIDDISVKQYRRLYKALSQDIRREAAARGVERAWNNANRFSSRVYDQAELSLRAINRFEAPEQVVELMRRAGNRSATRLRAIRSATSPQTWRAIQSDFVRRLGRTQQGDVEVFSPDTFMRQFNTLDPQMKRAMFGRSNGLLQGLEDLSEAAKRIQQVGREGANPSGTARANINFLSGLGVTSGLVGGLMGVPGGFTAAGAAVIPQASAFTTAKLLTNPAFVRWAARATKLGNTSIPAHIARLSEVLKNESPDIQIAASEFLENIQAGMNDE